MSDFEKYFDDNYIGKEGDHRCFTLSGSFLRKSDLKETWMEASGSQSEKIKDLEKKLHKVITEKGQAEGDAIFYSDQVTLQNIKLARAVEALEFVKNYDCDGFVENFAFCRGRANEALKQLSEQ